MVPLVRLSLESERLSRAWQPETATRPDYRLFVCARCLRQVAVCSHCDCGQVYCEGECAAQARQESVREAGRRYQQTRTGRRLHAARQTRYRKRQARRERSRQEAQARLRARQARQQARQRREASLAHEAQARVPSDPRDGADHDVADSPFAQGGTRPLTPLACPQELAVDRRSARLSVDHLLQKVTHQGTQRVSVFRKLPGQPPRAGVTSPTLPSRRQRSSAPPVRHGDYLRLEPSGMMPCCFCGIICQPYARLGPVRHRR